MNTRPLSAESELDRLEALLENDEIPECEHENAEHHAAQPARCDEPGCAESWYCPDCDEWFSVDEATRLGI